MKRLTFLFGSLSRLVLYYVLIFFFSIFFFLMIFEEYFVWIIISFSDSLFIFISICLTCCLIKDSLSRCAFYTHAFFVYFYFYSTKKIHWVSLSMTCWVSLSFFLFEAYSHSTSIVVRPPKLSKFQPGQYLDDRLGITGILRFDARVVELKFQSDSLYLFSYTKLYLGKVWIHLLFTPGMG